MSHRAEDRRLRPPHTNNSKSNSVMDPHVFLCQNWGGAFDLVRGSITNSELPYELRLLCHTLKARTNLESGPDEVLRAGQWQRYL